MDKPNYIVVEGTEAAMPYIYDHIKNQKNVNGRVALCMFLIGTCLLALDKHIREQSKTIEDLSNEVKELKQMRGE